DALAIGTRLPFLRLTDFRGAVFRAPDGAFLDTPFVADRARLTAPVFLTLATLAHSLQVTDVAVVRGLFGSRNVAFVTGLVNGMAALTMPSGDIRRALRRRLLDALDDKPLDAGYVLDPRFFEVRRGLLSHALSR